MWETRRGKKPVIVANRLQYVYNQFTQPVGSEMVKVLQETRDIAQALVSQLQSQGIDDAGVRFQQENRGFSEGRQRVQCYGCREIGQIIRDCRKKLSRSGDSNGNTKREERLHQGQQRKSH